MFVMINLFGQLGGAVLVLARKYVEVACGILLGIIALQVSKCCVSFESTTYTPQDENFHWNVATSLRANS